MELAVHSPFLLFTSSTTYRTVITPRNHQKKSICLVIQCVIIKDKSPSEVSSFETANIKPYPSKTSGTILCKNILNP